MTNIENEYKDFKEDVIEKSIVAVENKWKYLVSGNEAKTLLILNGGLRVADSAFKYINLFNKDFKVIVPSYPSLSSIEKMIDGVKEIIKIESNEETYVFCQSYGGMIGQCLIQKYPEVTDKIILSGTAPILATEKELFKLKLRAMLISFLPNNIVSKIYKKNLLKVISYPKKESVFWKDYLNQIFDNNLNKKDALSHFKTSIGAINKFSFLRNENNFKGNVLLLKGENDSLINDHDINLLEDYYNYTTIKTVPCAGHTSAFENPEAFYNTIMTFL